MSENKKIEKHKFELENYQYPDKFGNWLGYEILRVDASQKMSEVRLQIREDHLSPARRVHGGVISAFFDFAFGVALFSTLGPKDFCSTVELKVNYLRPIELNDVLTAKSSIVFRGNKLCVLHGFIYRNEEKDPVAMGSATFNVVVDAKR